MQPTQLLGGPDMTGRRTCSEEFCIAQPIRQTERGGVQSAFLLPETVSSVVDNHGAPIAGTAQESKVECIKLTWPCNHYFKICDSC